MARRQFEGILLGWFLFLNTACGQDPPPEPKPPRQKPAPVKAEAAPLVVPTEAPTIGPERQGRAIEIVLESSPPGAHVAVDGLSLGATPTLWRGFADGKGHDFTFTMVGHLPANYRFIPIQNGVVHGTLVAATLKKKENPR